MDSDKDRSCWMCGYFGPRGAKAEQRDDHSGRCHAFDDENGTESLLIISGSERDTAIKCKRYFRRSRHLTLAEFLSWRSSIANDLHKQVTERQFRIITLLLAGCAFVDFACKAFGLWK
ncbi:hypothetical protein FY034_17600 (plasmid) [Trichlorobacter lovleyi]|uniref:hypothetical protein n=1 Tax=Trichlorobacter lovleyi TaxID=313985 RepID=UPI00223EE81C|nr:hypothetical protein [Trichlorobacter lovleyi]QOX80839.1 hypothetical protein FY034_17600 [Trichlorobacter lovleyi]